MEVLTGFFRCTDILFHYHHSLKNQRAALQLQKVLERDSFLHPRHPLASQEEGKSGIQAHIGTFHDGQARLLFSSAQCDYLRHWMVQMQLTKKLIPFPYSDCMFLDSDIASLVPIVFENLAALSENSKKLGRMNSHLKANPLLVNRRSIFESVRRLCAEKKGVWCALNIDAWTLDHTVILDIGWSLVRWDSSSEIAQSAHLVVTKNQTYSATSLEGAGHESVTMSVLKQKLEKLFEDMQQHGPIFLISDDSKGIVKYLRSQLQISIPDACPVLSETTVASGTMYIVDHKELFNALIGRSDHETDPKPLERICKLLNVPFKSIRNAGADSKTALELVRSMAAGPQLDSQREQRWPLQTETQVVFQPWEDDPNYADLQGLIPPQK
ncbi:hypothetical protein C8F01DRAFT_1117894 [Mycena amicta]|nr:hypothetical protein C8F01DRAFT_1117894 [Mycena amicta]